MHGILKWKHAVVAAFAGIAAAILVCTVGSSFATGNDQIKGLIMWGTSGMSRLYGDLNEEEYNDSATRTGEEEADQHIWVSYHKSDGSGYGYYNLGKFTNYTVSDASSWYEADDGDTSLSTVSVMRSSLSGAYIDGSGNSSSANDSSITSIAQGIMQAKSNGWITDEDCKTAVVIWAGEDWIVRNAESSDDGFKNTGSVSGAKLLQTLWMGMDVEVADPSLSDSDYFYHSFDPFPGVNSIDPEGDVKHEDNPLTGGFYAPEGEYVTEHDYPNETLSSRISVSIAGSTAISNYTHTYVFDNSYLINESKFAQWEDDGTGHFSSSGGFSYNKDEDGIDVTLDHELESPTDAFPEDSDLPTQVATCFGRILSGYSYSVEYLQQDMSQTSSHTDTETDISVWVATYTSASDETLTYGNGQYQTVTRTDGWYTTASFGSSTYTTTKTTSQGHNQAHEATVTVTDSVTGVRYYYTETTTTVTVSTDEDTGVTTTTTDTDTEYNVGPYSSAPSGYSTVTTTSTGTITVTVTYTLSSTEYYHDFSTTIVVHHPAYYTWSQVPYTVHTRCDSDLAPDPGFADSSHVHKYGGLDGLDESGTQLTTTIDNGSDVENYDSSGNLISSHATDYTEVTTWFTNPDKPIMEVVTESRQVLGYIGYWQRLSSASLKVYVFGLGPYSKAVYDDEKDEDPTDVKITRDTNGDGEISAMDRADTNNKNTISVSASVVSAHPEWIVGGTEDSEWDLTTKGGTVSGSNKLDEITRTDRVDGAVQTYNSILKSTASSASFVDIYDIVLENTPYYRYQDEINSGIDDDKYLNAEHGKWYDVNTYQWIFHMMWSTVLADNPNPDADASIDLSLYSLSCSLTAYMNTVVSPTGRTDDSGDAIHTLDEAQAAGAANAGAFLGYGDEDYSFVEYVTTSLSSTSSTVDYTSLIGLENNGGSGSSMYLYARYGRLLADMGIDEVSTSEVVSSRTIPGLLISVCYIANMTVSSVWSVTLYILKALNPFQFLANATAISAGLKSGMYDASESIVVQAAASNSAVADILAGIGAAYDVIADMGGIMLIIYGVFLIASILLFRRIRESPGKRIQTYAIRFVFICVGVPLLASCYTSTLSILSDSMDVATAPASEMVAATFVDFSGWVKESRLSPVSGGTFESAGSSSLAAGEASDDTIVNLRKTAAAINESTGILSEVDVSNFVSDASDVDEWNENSITISDTTTTFWSSNSEAVQQVFSFLTSYTSGGFYYASDFNSDTMGNMAQYLTAYVGRQKGVDEDTDDTGWDNSNTFFQLAEATSGTDTWLDRSVSENTAIFTGSGDYGSGSTTDSDWSMFNVYANGALKASVTSNVKQTTNVTYTEGSVSIYSGQELPGINVASKTGLSTVSMYNYLMTDFGKSSMTIYSPVNAVSTNTAQAHRKTTLIGTGVYEWIFYLNCMVYMLVCAVIGLVYSLRMGINVLKNGFRALTSIPAAMLGIMKSIAQMVGVVILMIAELLTTIVMYTIVIEFLYMLVTAFETLISTVETSLTASGILGLIMAQIPVNSAAVYMVYLTGITLFVLGIGCFAMVKAEAFMRVWCKSLDLAVLELILTEKEQQDAYLYPEKEPETGGCVLPEGAI